MTRPFLQTCSSIEKRETWLKAIKTNHQIFNFRKVILDNFLLIGIEVVEACPVALLEEFKVDELLELEFVACTSEFIPEPDEFFKVFSVTTPCSSMACRSLSD